MIPDKIHLIITIVPILAAHTFSLLRQKISAIIHKRTYKPLPAEQTKNIVVVGGSFGGVSIVRRLVHTLPPGYRVILIEKNSHLNYLFTFPRFSVVKGYEKLGFIPYDGLATGAPDGIYERVQDTVTGLEEDHVTLSGGEKIEFAYLVVTTGTRSPLPNKVTSYTREGGMAELKGMQNKIEDAKRIAVVGGGAVGVELAGDIKEFYPEKDVALIHSRDRLLPSFGNRLHEHTVKIFEKLGVAILLNERPQIPAEGNTLQLLNGKEETFDLILPCTGQKPNSGIISSLSPSSISKTTSRILVRPTLQLSDTNYPHIFSFGDVAETGGPKMARAAHMQAEVVLANILSLIKGNDRNLQFYRPKSFEGSIKLTLGKTQHVMYLQKENGRELVVPIKGGAEDLGVKQAWGFFGADPKTA